MTKFDLKKLKSLKKEIEILQQQLDKIKIQPKLVSDSVKGSMIRFPYTEHTITITGIDTEGYSQKVHRIRRALAKKMKEALALVDEINQYIDSVEDPETRNILRLRYVDCMTWEEIAEELHMCERTVRRKFQKWWNSN